MEREVIPHRHLQSPMTCEMFSGAGEDDEDGGAVSGSEDEENEEEIDTSAPDSVPKESWY